MYIRVKLAWIILALGTVATALCAWRFPHTVVPLTVGISTAGVLAVTLRL
jgi:hypothetical protein